MTDTNYKKISRIIAILFFSGFITILVIFWNRLVFPVDFRMFKTSGNENLAPGEPLAQKFPALENNLSQVNILLEDIGKVLAGDKLTVSILDEKCAETIRIAKLERPANIPKQYERFAFDPIPDSKDKTYCLKILYESPEKRKSRPFVRKMKNTGNASDQFVNLKSGKIYAGQTLIFRPAYAKKSASAAIGELIRRLSAYKANYLQGSSLLWIFGGFILSALAAAFILIFSRERE